MRPTIFSSNPSRRPGLFRWLAVLSLSLFLAACGGGGGDSGSSSVSSSGSSSSGSSGSGGSPQTTHPPPKPGPPHDTRPFFYQPRAQRVFQFHQQSHTP